MRCLTKWVLVFVVLASTSGLSSAVPTFEIVTVGSTFHGEEVRLSSTKGWLALYKTTDGFELAAVELRIEAAFDAVIDEDKANPTGKNIRVEPSRKDDPVLLIHEAGTSTLRPGKVDGRSFDSTAGQLFPGESIPIEISGAYFQIEAIGSALFDPKSNSLAMKDYELVLAHRDARQSLMKLPELRPPEYRQRLLWSGDLDRDGRVDFLVDLSTHYNETRRTLFLSSLSKEPELVRKVAEFVTTGC